MKKGGWMPTDGWMDGLINQLLDEWINKMNG